MIEYFSVITTDEVLTQATIWINLENMLNERRQTQKTTYCVIPFI